MDGARLGTITRRTAERHEMIVALAVMRPELLAEVDPIAARSAAGGRSTAVWYIRSMVSPRAGEHPQIVWAVIDDTTGTVLGYSWPEA